MIMVQKIPNTKFIQSSIYIIKYLGVQLWIAKCILATVTIFTLRVLTSTFLAWFPYFFNLVYLTFLTLFNHSTVLLPTIYTTLPTY